MSVRPYPFLTASWSRATAACLMAVACIGAAPAQAEPPSQIRPMRSATATPAAPAPTVVRVDLTAPAEARAAAGAPPAVDPMEQLRQRLAGKLSRQTLADDGASPYDLKVVARTTPPATRPETARPSERVVASPRAPRATATATTAAAAATGMAWSYQGDAGPAAWARLRPEYALCGNGQRQSPVDIRGGLAVDLEPVKFSYADSRFGVIDNGHTVQASIAPGSHLEIGGQRFELLHMRFHRPSETRIDGRQFEMSAHLLHRDAQGRLAMLALMIDRGPAHPVVQTVWNNLPLERGEEVPARVMLDLEALLPADRRYYTYMGSLTTPPCTEDVRWIVMREPLTMSAEQIELFARIYPMNARPVQQLAGRRILQSQ